LRAHNARKWIRALRVANALRRSKTRSKSPGPQQWRPRAISDDSLFDSQQQQQKQQLQQSKQEVDSSRLEDLAAGISIGIGSSIGISSGRDLAIDSRDAANDSDSDTDSEESGSNSGTNVFDGGSKSPSRLNTHQAIAHNYTKQDESLNRSVRRDESGAITLTRQNSMISHRVSESGNRGRLAYHGRYQSSLLMTRSIGDKLGPRGG
jgi:hypothetical protein